jgi:putative transposase
MNDRLNEYSFRAWCDGLKVSSSGFYAWRKREHEPKAVELELKRTYEQHRGKAGAPMLCPDLNAVGFNYSIRTVSRLMKKAGLRAKLTRKYRITADSNHKLPVAPNLS